MVVTTIRPDTIFIPYLRVLGKHPLKRAKCHSTATNHRSNAVAMTENIGADSSC